jgi:hypothetical protein
VAYAQPRLAIALAGVESDLTKDVWRGKNSGLTGPENPDAEALPSAVYSDFVGDDAVNLAIWQRFRYSCYARALSDPRSART